MQSKLYCVTITIQKQIGVYEGGYMSKNYCFEFLGTREQFLEPLYQYPNNDRKFFYFNDYIVEISGDMICFGVARGGHLGGYWFKPTITEIGNRLQFSGKIEYIGSYTKDSKFHKTVDKIEEGCLFVILLPLLLLVKLYLSIKNLIQKIRKKPIIKEETTEDRLFYLMETLLNCTRK